MRLIFFLGSGLLCVVALSLFAFPYLATALYLNQGAVVSNKALLQRPTSIESLSRAADLLQQAIWRDGNNAEAYRLLARVYSAKGLYGPAVEALSIASALQPDSPLIGPELANAYGAMVEENKEKALVEYTKLADSYLQSGNSDQALVWLRQVLEIAPDNLYGLYHSAKILEAMGKDQEAQAAFDKLRHFGLAGIKPRNERLQQLTAKLIPELVRDNVWALDDALRIVSFLAWQGAWDEAEQAIAHLLERWSGDPRLYLYQGEIFRRKGQNERAISSFEQVTTRHPQIAQAYLALGQLHELGGDLKRAIAYYQDYRKLALDDLWGLEKLAQAYERLQPGEAKALWDEFTRKTSNKRIVAEVMGLREDQFELGKDLIDNKGLERGSSRPEGWTWSLMAGLNLWNEALFLGGPDDFEGFQWQRSMRIDGLWIQRLNTLEGARAGYWGGEIGLKPETAYILSFYYKTSNTGDGNAAVWVSYDPEVLFGGDHMLAKTEGKWRKYVVIGWNQKKDAGIIKPLLRSWTTGQVWFDDVRLEEIIIKEKVQVRQTSTQFLLR